MRGQPTVRQSLTALGAAKPLRQEGREQSARAGEKHKAWGVRAPGKRLFIRLEPVEGRQSIRQHCRPFITGSVVLYPSPGGSRPRLYTFACCRLVNAAGVMPR